MTDLGEKPFQDQFDRLLRDGEKTATTRSDKWGIPGDRFRASLSESGGRCTFELTHVVKVPLHVVALFFFREEGLRNPEDFIQVWVSLHPRLGYDPDTEKWLHLFRRVQ